MQQCKKGGTQNEQSWCFETKGNKSHLDPVDKCQHLDLLVFNFPVNVFKAYEADMITVPKAATTSQWNNYLKKLLPAILMIGYLF